MSKKKRKFSGSVECAICKRKTQAEMSPSDVLKKSWFAVDVFDDTNQIVASAFICQECFDKYFAPQITMVIRY